MITVHIEREFEESPEILFDLLADHTKHTIWNPNIIKATLHDKGPIVKGSKGTIIGKSGKRRYENEIFYDTYDRPNFVSGGTSSGNIHSTLSNKFVATDKGTKITYHLEASFKGFMRLLQPFLKKSLISQKQEELDALQQYVSKNKQN